MGAVLILTPVIIAGWPAITAAVVGAASAMGLLVSSTAKEKAKQKEEESEKSVEVELTGSEVAGTSLASQKEIVVTKGDIELRIKRDEQGRCIVCAKGKGHNEAELKMLAEQFGQKMTQCYIYDKVVSELKNKDFQVVNEEVTDDETIRIHVRRWVD